MKIIFKAYFFSLILISCGNEGQTRIVEEKDYTNVATDMCECMDFHLSKKMSAILSSSQSESEFEQKSEVYAEEDPFGAINDATLMMNLENRLDSCMKVLEPKYKDLVTKESQETIMNRMLQHLRKTKNCSDLTNMMEIGMKMGQ